MTNSTYRETVADLLAKTGGAIYLPDAYWQKVLGVGRTNFAKLVGRTKRPISVYQMAKIVLGGEPK